MNTRISLIGLMICSLFFISSCNMPGGDIDMEEGLYKITYRTEITGMPVPMPPITLTQCLTKENPVPNQSSDNQECQITNMKKHGNIVIWKMECKQRGSSMKATGKMIFREDSLGGKTEMKMETESGNRVIITYMEGKRIGPCK